MRLLKKEEPSETNPGIRPGVIAVTAVVVMGAAVTTGGAGAVDGRVAIGTRGSPGAYSMADPTRPGMSRGRAKPRGPLAAVGEC